MHVRNIHRPGEGRLMTSVKSSGFIFKGPAMRPTRHRAVLRSTDFVMRVIGVESVEEAMSAAASMVADGVEVVELCGAFDEADAHRVRLAIGATVAVGVVTFSDEVDVAGNPPHRIRQSPTPPPRSTGYR